MIATAIVFVVFVTGLIIGAVLGYLVGHDYRNR